MPLDRVSVRQQQTMTLKPSFSGNNSGKKKALVGKKGSTLLMLFYYR